MRNCKILLLINWKEDGEWSLYKDLLNRFEVVHILQPLKKGMERSKVYKVSKYLSEFYLPFIAIFFMKKYDIIFSWSMRIGILYGIINRLIKFKHKAKHVIYDFHLNLQRTDSFYRFRILLCKLAIKGIDFFFTTSTKEEIIYSNMFSISANSIRFFPITAPEDFFSYDSPIGSYIFSYGNSDRDYDTLIKAVRDLNLDLIILSQKYKPKDKLPDNVKLITKPHYGEDLIRLILHSRFVVLPLVSKHVSAGQTALLESMALGKAVIVTENFATKEYGIHGENIFFFSASNDKELRSLIMALQQDPDYIAKVGKKAKESVKNLPEVCLKVLDEVCTLMLQEAIKDA